MKRAIRVVTRGSALALVQTTKLVGLLRERNPDVTFEVTTLTTTGDRVTDRPLSRFRGMGVFVKELERSLLAGEADIAIHSLKDVPVERVEGLTLAAFPKRENPFDLLLTKGDCCIDELPSGAVIGTSSPRRMVQLRAHRRDFVFKDLRGNVDTRLHKLEEGQYDAIVAAAAGMLRLGRKFDERSLLPMEICLPAAGQGSLAVECREDDTRTAAIAQSVDDPDSRLAVLVEREFLAAIGGGCQTPVAVYAAVEGDRLIVKGAIGDEESAMIIRDSESLAKEKAKGMGKKLAERMLERSKRSV